jgi:tetratricopeptide (TPR) repeat protein
MADLDMNLLRLRDFDIEIGPAVGNRYPVAVLNSPSGQARAAMNFPWEPAELEARLAALEDAVLGGGGAAAGQDTRTFGSQLFDALLTGEVRTVYDRSRQAVEGSGEGLRVKLRVNAPELATVPWEFLYDPRAGEFLALSRLTPIVRYLELPLGEQALAVKPPLRILGLVAGPADAPPLDVAREKARLDQAVQPLQAAGRVEMVWLEGQSWRSLQAAMQAGPWHIFHFVGHAAFDPRSAEGVLLLTNDDGRSAPVSASQLAGLLADHHTLRLAVLNACEGAKGSEQSRFSSIAAGLVRRGLPAVLAMQYEISDRAAIEFTASFYGALAAGLPIDAATSEARKAIDLALAGSLEWGTPLLTMRTPDGTLWDVQQRRKLPALAMTGIAAVALLVVSLLVWIAVQVSPANGPPPPMTGAFNIAVASFGEIDSATGQVTESTAGQAVSQWLFDGLQRELQANVGQVQLADQIDLRHDATTPAIRGNTSDARAAAAAELARAINAHMVVYGYLAPEGSANSLQVELYVSPQASKDEFGGLVGGYALGSALRLPQPFDTSNQLANIGVSEQVTLRSRILFWLTLGLTQDLLGRSEQALATFQQAEQALTDWRDTDGKEMLYYLQGREHLFLRQLDEAQQAFARALAASPDFARAAVALGSVEAYRANQLADSAARLEPDSPLRRAIDAQRSGLALAEAESDGYTAAVARIALAQSLDVLCISQLNVGQIAEAQTACSEAAAQAGDAIAFLDDIPEQRLLAQAWLAQGLAHYGQNFIVAAAGDSTAARVETEAAIAAFERCIGLGDATYFDQVLRERVIAEACQPNLQAAQDRLKQLEGP